MTEEDLTNQARIITELIKLAETPEQIDLLSNWAKSPAVVDLSKMQETNQSLRKQNENLSKHLDIVERIYNKIIVTMMRDSGGY